MPLGPDRWTADGSALEEYVAGIADYQVATAAFKAAVERWPKSSVTLRQGTRVLSEGGYYARVFLNVEGREPNGAIPKHDVLRFRDELKAKLEATTDPAGKLLGTLVFKPEEIYHDV